MRTLSQKLDGAEEGDLGTLPILGFWEEKDEEVFQLLFVVPKAEQNTQTLLSAFETVDEMPSLNTRIDICFQPAEAILHVHNVRLVHEKIRLDDVIILRPWDDYKKPTDYANEMPKLMVFFLG